MWIEHIVHALVAVVDRLIVLNFGRKIAEGHPATVMGSAEVREIYMGLRHESVVVGQATPTQHGDCGCAAATNHGSGA